MENIQKLLKEILAAGLTQSELAEYIGVTQGTISKILNGTLTNINYDTGKKIELVHQQITRKKIID